MGLHQQSTLLLRYIRKFLVVFGPGTSRLKTSYVCLQEPPESWDAEDEPSTSKTTADAVPVAAEPKAPVDPQKRAKALQKKIRQVWDFSPLTLSFRPDPWLIPSDLSAFLYRPRTSTIPD